MSAEQFTSKAASSSYRPRGYGISPGLQRARLRFRFPNTITGITVASFVLGVWAYSISAVKQDVFDDVDAEARALNAVAEGDERSTLGLMAAASGLLRDDEINREKVANLPEQDANVSNRPKGLVLAALGDKHPWLFEPIHKTLIWGAPPVDHPGRIQDKIVVVWKR